MPAFNAVTQAKRSELSPARSWRLLIPLVLGGNSGGDGVVIHLDKDSHLSIFVNKMTIPHYSSRLCKSDRGPSVCLGTWQEIKSTRSLP